MKPMLKPPGIDHLKLKCDILDSTFAFKFNLSRYSVDKGDEWEYTRCWDDSKVLPAGYCPPRHRPAFQPSWFESTGVLCRGQQ